ncbi:conserved hypothetical protein [Culex quinquefasciatus]|uniref:ubiquitinyl hydrolase 1 n=1 Tax=Culex quinquefasciatus TaxID=7176 RepID=B0XG19_CULQU|nr:conserved hypothetical protein [Culex quinquefasciatus]|eukprot:XP_001868591.1 conserved hypothetical protein [Culex quinquefasciatus]
MLLKPALTNRLDDILTVRGKKLERGISRATENVNLVSRARQEFEMDFHSPLSGCAEQNAKNLNFIDTPDYTFTLPDLTKRGSPPGRSEWAREWEEIVAIASPEPRRNSKSGQQGSGAGAASRRRSLLIEKSMDGGEGGDENAATYESLEEIHVLALAHILRRTIIVVSDVFLRDMNGEAFSPIPFGGVYLPFEVPSNECHRAPLLLAYDMAHFSALVAMETAGDFPPALIPLVDASNQLLPIQFCIDPGRDFDWREYDGADGNWVLTDREHVALLKEYLDIVYAPATADSPDGEPDTYDDYSDEEYEKRLADGEFVFADENHNSGTNLAAMTASNQSLPPTSSSGKSKAAKQLQSVAKQFGSIGKSMSKKLKKNIGSITRIGSKSGSHKKPNVTANKDREYPKFRILCATLKARRHEYQEEMIKNYLECAQERYLELERSKERRELDKLSKYVDSGHDMTDYGSEPPTTDLVNCINAGCLNYGTVATSYMCLECYETQKKRETINVTDFTPRYGTGKSKFYAQADMESHDRIQRLPSVRRLNELDQTLYLSHSTFYNDQRAAMISNAQSLQSSSNYRHGFSPTDRTKNGHHSPPNYSTCAKLATATSGGIVATVYSPGNTILNRVPPSGGMCVSLPPPSPSPQQPTPQLPSASSSSGMSSSSSSGSNTSETLLRQQQQVNLAPSGGGATTSSHYGKSQMCRTEGCKFYGSINTNFYCSKCCQEYNI